MSEIAYVDDSAFEEQVLKSELPVLVDFTASWCGPCKMLAPIVEQMAAEWEGKVKVVKFDVDSNKDTPFKYSIMGVPTLMLFIDGEIVERLTGFKPKKHLLKTFGGHLEG